MKPDIKRNLNLVRYGGIVVTLVVFIALVGFALVAGGALGASGTAFNEMLPYIALITVITAVLSVVFYFAYGAFLRSRTRSG